MKISLVSLLVFGVFAVAVHASDPSAYPLSTCLVSGEKLGEMGNPVVITYQGTEIRFCCKHCVETFKKDPTKYLAKLKAVAQKP